MDILIANQRTDQGMNSTTEFQVAAKPDREMIEASFQAADRQKICQRLGRMLMSTITGVDDRNAGMCGSNHRSTFFWMTHGADVCKAGNDADRIGNAFSFGCGRGTCIGKTDDLSAQIDHGAFKAQSGSGTWFVEAGCKLLSVAPVCVFLWIFFDVCSQIEKLLKFICRKIQWTHYMSHSLFSFR